MKYTLQDLQPHIATCRAELRPTKGGKTGDTNAENLAISLNKEGSIRRKWLGIYAKDIYIFKAFLDYYTCASNDNPQGYVDDPIVADAEGKQMKVPGRYRNAFTIVRQTEQDRYELVQELRLGWVEQLVDGTGVDYSEARCDTIDWYVGDAGSNATNDYITLVWKGISPERVEAIAESLIGLSSQGWTPVVNGNQLGSHHRLLVRTAEEPDGSHSVRVLLANSRLTYDAYQSWGSEQQGSIVYHFGVPSDMVQSVVDAEERIGATARISPADQRGLHDITISYSDPEPYEGNQFVTARSCSEITYMTMYLGLTEEQMEEVDIAVAAVGERLSLRRQSRGDGFWDVTVVVDEVQSRTPITDVTIEISPSGTTTETQILGYKEEDLPDFDEVAGSIKSRNVRVNERCDVDIIDRTSTPTNQVSQDKLDNEDRTVVVDKNTEKAAQEVVSVGGARVDGTFERVSNDPTRAGNFQTAKETHTVKDRTTTQDVVREDVEEGVVEHSAAANPATIDLNLTDFEVQTVESAETEYKNRYRTRVQTRTRKNQTTTSYDSDRTDDRVTVRQTQADQPGTPAPILVGRKVIVVTPTETKKFEVQESTETPLPFDTGWVDYPNRDGVMVRVFINSSVTDFVESAEDADDAWPYPDGNNTLRISPKSNGRYDLTGFSQPDTDSSAGATSRCDFTESTTQFNRATAAVVIGTPAYNEHVEIRNVLKPDGSYSTTKTVRVFKNQTGIAVQLTPTETSRTDIDTQVNPATLGAVDVLTGEITSYTIPSAPTVAGGGGEVRLTITPTQTCAKRVEETTITPIEFDTDWVEYETKWGTAYVRSIINATQATLDGFQYPGDGLPLTIPDPEGEEGDTIPNPDANVTANHDRGFSVSPQANGRYGISASARPTTRGGGGGLADLDDEDYQYTIQNASGTFAIDIYHTSSITKAVTYLNKAPSVQSGGAGVTAGILYIGRGLFKVTRCIKVE